MDEVYGMDGVYAEYTTKQYNVAEYTTKQYSIPVFDYQRFYEKSKVPICLAITECLPFLQELKDAGFLSEEESLELQADTRSVHRVVYESLCWIEEKNINLQRFFEHLFQESYLKKFLDLTPILQEYNEKKRKNSTPIPPDTESDHLIFAQEKVPICLAITDRFPFLHGLQDLTILSETESLKLQADERPVSRVIYECLSVIEKKDMKLNVVFEYIFQQCYLKVYPGLQDILQGPSGDQAGPFNGRQFPVFSRPKDLLDFFELNKTYICGAINERFPILHGLHDKGMLSKLHMLKLQADKRPTKEVLCEALGVVEQKDNIDLFFAYVFQEYYLDLFPDLNNILQSLNDALKLEIYPLSSVSCPDQVNEIQDQESSGSSTDLEDTATAPIRKCRMKHISYTEPPDYDLEFVNGRKRRKGLNDALKRDIHPLSSDLEDTVTAPVRSCRMKQVNYTEPPDYDLEFVNGKKRHKDPECTVPVRFKKRCVKETKSRKPTGRKWDSVTKPVAVKLELPKQVFSDSFQVKCGNKTGLFLKKHWTGDSRIDKCIRSEGNRFSVIRFEKYGGKESSKNWKKSISCERIPLDTLMKSGVLKSSKRRCRKDSRKTL